MGLGRRLGAALIDFAVCLTLLPVMLFGTAMILFTSAEIVATETPMGEEAWVTVMESGHLYLLAVAFLWPLMYMAVPTAIWGRSLGKLITGLKVTDLNGEKAALGRVVLRETIKIACVYFMIGLIIMLFQAFQGGPIFHDQLCGTQVEHKPRVRLTDTQKQWREFYGRK